MSRATQAVLLILAIVTWLCSAWTVSIVNDLAVRQRAEHDTVVALRAELARVKADQHETEVALDREALENGRLTDELRVEKLNAELDKRRRTM